MNLVDTLSACRLRTLQHTQSLSPITLLSNRSDPAIYEEAALVAMVPQLFPTTNKGHE